MSNFPKIFKRSPTPAPRYYIYISQTKVEMLVLQIPASHLRSLEAEIKVNVAAFAVGVKKPASTPSPELTAKTKVLSDYLEKQEGWVGTVASPGRYVKGLASLQYGVIGAAWRSGSPRGGNPYPNNRSWPTELRPRVAFFGGDVDGVKVGLIGSSESLIGAALTDIAANHSLPDYDLQFRRSVAWEASEADVDELLRHAR